MQTELGKKQRRWFFALAALAAMHGMSAFGLDTLDERTPGLDAVNYEKTSDFFFQGDTIFLDGKITTYPPNLTTYDRTLVTILKGGTNINLGEKFALRFIMDTRYNIRKAYEEKEPRNVITEEWFEAKPSLDGLIKLGTDFEVFAGGKFWYLPSHKKETESVNFKVTETFEDAFVLIPRVGLVKRSNYLSGGLYYEQRKEVTRKVEKDVSDGTTLEADDVVFNPTVIALFLRFKMWGYPVDTEFDSVRAAEGGPKTADGDNIYDDHAVFRIGVFVPWPSMGLNYHFSLVHKTISYAESSQISLDTIPMTSLHVKVISGTPDRHAFVGFIYGHGSDKQSLPEFNAKYNLNAYGAKLGLNYRF